MRLDAVGIAAAVIGVALSLLPETGGRSPAAAARLDVPEPARPKPPAAYTLPPGARRVSSSQELRTALDSAEPTAIVLAPGVYDNPRPFSNRTGHRLYAARLGKAVLRAGLVVGANEGGANALVRGLTFDVRDSSKTLNGAAIEVWGSARGARVLDIVVRGHGASRAGIVVRQPDGFRGRRVVVSGFTDYGIVVDANDVDRATGRGFLLEDVEAANVARRPRGSAHGTAEACVWVGNTGVVRRVRVRNCGWMGLWTGTAATRTLVADVDVDRTPTGVYIEHFTRRSTFRSIHVRRHVEVGVSAEWASPDWGSKPASTDNVIQDSIFESRLCGVYLDEGTTRTTVRRSIFRGQTWAAIGDYRGRGNVFSGNDYSGIARTAVPVSHDHLSDARR